MKKNTKNTKENENKKTNMETKKEDKALKEEILNELNPKAREDRRKDKKTKVTEENIQDRRTGTDRRNNNLVGGRRKTDITEEEAKEFEKILSSGDGETVLNRLKEKNYRNLNDEAKKLEIKKTIGIHNLTIKRLTSLLFLVIFATSVISIVFYFLTRQERIRKANQTQVRQIQQKLDKELQNRVDNATLENLDKAFKKEDLKKETPKPTVKNK